MSEALLKHVTYHIEHLIRRDNAYTPEDIAKSAIRAMQTMTTDKSNAVEAIGDLIAHETAQQEWKDTDFYAIAKKVLEMQPPAPSGDILNGEWQDISTAPKDGTPILVFGTRFGWAANPSRVCAFYKANAWWIYGGSSGEPSKQRSERNVVIQTLDTIDPTHWMPLPNPPQESAK
jgi:hypothetical protein